MRTPVHNQKALTLGELMRIAGELRRTGFSPAQPTGLLSARQLRGAVASFVRYRQHTRMALLVYLMFLVLVLGSYVASSGLYITGLCIICFLGFLAFLGFSSHHKTAFYEAIGRTRSAQPALYTFLGLPFYFLLYYRLERSMRYELTTVFRESGLTDPK